MIVAQPPELPDELLRAQQKARRLEWITIGYMTTAVLVMGLVSRSSQAMKAAWADDALSLIPPIAFLVASHVSRRRPNQRYPYGYSRAVGIAYLTSSLALLAFGALLFFDSGLTLLRAERPSIGSVQLFGRTVWMGWLMFPALAYSVVPTFVLGRMKLKLARVTNDKALHADADMNKADWLAGLAVMAGVLGIAVGWWWADAVAAIIVSSDILHDGVKNLRHAVTALMDHRPRTVDFVEDDPLARRVIDELRAMSWVADAAVRLRDDGNVYFGEAYVVPTDEEDITGKIEAATQRLREVDWRVQEVSVVPVRRIEGSWKMSP